MKKKKKKNYHFKFGAKIHAYAQQVYPKAVEHILCKRRSNRTNFAKQNGWPTPGFKTLGMLSLTKQGKLSFVVWLITWGKTRVISFMNKVSYSERVFARDFFVLTTLKIDKIQICILKKKLFSVIGKWKIHFL